MSAVVPSKFLSDLVNEKVAVKLKWGMEYHGFLVSVDPYMNIQLSSTEEYVNGNLEGELGDVLIRCNNILYVQDLKP